MAETNLMYPIIAIAAVIYMVISFLFFKQYEKSIKEAKYRLDNLYRLVSTTVGDFKKVELFIEPTETNRKLLKETIVKDYLNQSRITTKSVLIGNKMYYQLMLRSHCDITIDKVDEISYDLQQFGISTKINIYDGIF